MYNRSMPTETKPSRRARGTRAVRQSITLPAPLAVEVRRLAKERHLTVSRAVASLVARGVQAEQGEKANLTAAYERFMSEADPQHQEEAGKDLIREVFGKDAIAGDSVL
jgi:predicted DNA-binding ribbon-helix-helix protein